MIHDTRRFAAILLALQLVGCAGSEDSDDRPSLAECQAARAREATLAVATATTPSTDARARTELARHQANLAQVGGAEALERCVATDSRARLRCVATATTSAAAAACAPP